MKKRLFIITVLTLNLTTAELQSRALLKPGYNIPAGQSAEALAIGNGRVDAMKFGNPYLNDNRTHVPIEQFSKANYLQPGSLLFGYDRFITDRSSQTGGRQVALHGIVNEQFFFGIHDSIKQKNLS